MVKIDEITSAELKKLIDDKKAILIDVREPSETKQEIIEGAIKNPLSSFDPDLIPNNDKTLVFYCRSGRRSMEAANFYSENSGKNCKNLQGGIIAWKESNYPTIS